MALKNLTSDEMVGVSGAWIDPKRARPVFEKHPLLTSLLPAIESVHASLGAAAAPTEGAAQGAAALAAVKKREVEIDRVHDRKARAVQYLLLGLIDASDDADEAEALRVLLVRLNLETLAVIQQTYLGESGNAQKIHDALHEDAALRDALKALPLAHKRTALDLVREWIAAGRELGTLEHEKSQLEAELSRTPETPSGASAAVTARNTWIRTTNAVLANASLIADLPPKDHATLFTALYRVSRTADARGAATAQPPTAPENP